MSIDLFIEIPGEPVGKGRPRFNSRMHRAYTPGKTAKYENLIKLAFHEKYPDWKPTEEPVEVYIRAEFPKPKSWTKRLRLISILTTIWKPTKPDIDNIVKTLDGLNKIAWKDDSQIVNVSAMKFYSDRPRMTIHITDAIANPSLYKLPLKRLEELVAQAIREEEEPEEEEELEAE